MRKTVGNIEPPVLLSIQGTPGSHCLVSVGDTIPQELCGSVNIVLLSKCFCLGTKSSFQQMLGCRNCGWSQAAAGWKIIHKLNTQ